MNDDLISRRAVFAKLNVLNDGALYTHADYVDAVRSVPTAEPESRREWYMRGYRDAQSERKTGRWIVSEPQGVWTNIYHCSECGEGVMSCKVDLPKFCGHCGAWMGGTE